MTKKIQFDCDPRDLIHKGNRHKNQHIPVNEEEEQLHNLEEFGIFNEFGMVLQTDSENLSDTSSTENLSVDNDYDVHVDEAVQKEKDDSHTFHNEMDRHNYEDFSTQIVIMSNRLSKFYTYTSTNFLLHQ